MHREQCGIEGSPTLLSALHPLTEPSSELFGQIEPEGVGPRNVSVAKTQRKPDPTAVSDPCLLWLLGAGGATMCKQVQPGATIGYSLVHPLDPSHHFAPPTLRLLGEISTISTSSTPG